MCKLLIILICFILTSCTYSKKYNCSDAKGAHCLMLSQIDKQINSGQIEKIYEAPRKCLFGICKNDKNKKEVPSLALQEEIKAKVFEEEPSMVSKEGEYLYVK